MRFQVLYFLLWWLVLGRQKRWACAVRPLPVSAPMILLKFGKVLILQLLPGTQGIYGLLIAFITLAQIGVLGGSADLSWQKGLLYLLGCLPMAIVGYASAIKQGKASIASDFYGCQTS